MAAGMAVAWIDMTDRRRAAASSDPNAVEDAALDVLTRTTAPSQKTAFGRIHNAYAGLMASSAYQGMNPLLPSSRVSDERPYIIIRGGDASTATARRTHGRAIRLRLEQPGRSRCRRS